MKLLPPEARLALARFRSILFDGLIAILPIAATLFLLFWLGATLEAVLGGLIIMFLPENAEGEALYYIPGMGLVLGFIIIFLVGVSLHTVFMKRALAWEEELLERIPVIRSVYSSVRDLMGYFTGSQQKEMNQVVLVTFPETKIQLVGFMTRQDFEDLPTFTGKVTEEAVGVYLPMSYQIGGFTVFIPRTAVQPLDMPFEDAMRFVLMAGVKPPEENGDGTPQPQQKSAPGLKRSPHGSRFKRVG